MDAILPQYERELAFLRTQAGDFAQRFPKIASQLMLNGEQGEDPHVERMIQSFALLAARIHKRLDDDFPLLTESLLDVLYPHYLRPFPSCSIAAVSLSDGMSKMTQAGLLPRGTQLTTRPVRGVTCRFRTAYDVALLPVNIVSAGYRSLVSPPEGTVLPKGAASVFSIQLELASPQATWETLGVPSVRVYLDGEASQVSMLREVLTGRATGALLQTSPIGPWTPLVDALPRLVGFAEDESLIDFDSRSHPAYRLLTEYFAFPEKFNFLDLPLPPALLRSGARTVTLHYVMPAFASDFDGAHLLETFDEKNFILGCTPVINLFTQRADPIRVTHTVSSYPVVVESRQAFGHEVYSIDKVYRVQQTPAGETISEFRPFYSLQHEHLLSDGESGGRYWSMHRDEAMAEHSPGYECELSIVDVDFDPASPQTDTLSIEVTATNRDLPSQLSVGNAGGDVFIEGGTSSIRLLRKPTRAYRFETGRGAQWRLVSHLSLNHLSLSAGGVDALKEMLRLYDLPRSSSTRRQLDGIVSIDFKPASACLPGNPFPTFVRGTEIRLTVDEQSFVGTGLRLFAQVLDHFFGLYAHINSFTQLRLFSSRTHEELLACPRRSGSTPLV